MPFRKSKSQSGKAPWKPWKKIILNCCTFSVLLLMVLIHRYLTALSEENRNPSVTLVPQPQSQDARTIDITGSAFERPKPSRIETPNVESPATATISGTVHEPKPEATGKAGTELTVFEPAGNAVMDGDSQSRVRSTTPDSERFGLVSNAEINRVENASNREVALNRRKLSDEKNDLASQMCVDREYRDAERLYSEAIQLDNDNPRPKMNLARLLATCPDASIRNGARAVELAIAGSALGDTPDWRYLAILAASYAENRNFDEAVRWGMKAKAMAAGADAGAMDVNLKLFRNRQPCRWDTGP